MATRSLRHVNSEGPGEEGKSEVIRERAEISKHTQQHRKRVVTVARPRTCTKQGLQTFFERTQLFQPQAKANFPPIVVLSSDSLCESKETPWAKTVPLNEKANLVLEFSLSQTGFRDAFLVTDARSREYRKQVEERLASK